MSSLAVWMLLAYGRERLTLSEDKIIQRGVLRTKAIHCQGVSRLRWQGVGGLIRIQSSTCRITIHLNNFKPEDRLWIISQLQSRIDETLQQDWGTFCVKIAVPLQRNETVNELGDNDNRNTITLKRTRWALYFIPATLACTVLGIFLSVKFGLDRSLAAPIMPLLLWIFMHFSTPKRGITTTRVSSVPGTSHYLWFLFVWGGIGLVGCAVFATLNLPLQQTIGLGVIIGVIWFAVLIWKSIQVDRQRHQHDESRASHAIEEWESRQRSSLWE